MEYFKIKNQWKYLKSKCISIFKKEFTLCIPHLKNTINTSIYYNFTYLYFSYDIIRYIENIPNNCKNDLNLPDVRLLRPIKLIIYDNLKKKIYFIVNCFKDKKISNYSKKFNSIKKEITDLKKLIILI